MNKEKKIELEEKYEALSSDEKIDVNRIICKKSYTKWLSDHRKFDEVGDRDTNPKIQNFIRDFYEQRILEKAIACGEAD